ncbi:MAG: UdgX family uracil-DNA binding protein [Rhodospirillales bacterium]
MHQVRLAAPDDFDGWRNAARALVRADVVPDAVSWVAPGESEDLFADTVLPPAAAPDASFTVPRRFRDLAADVVCHRDAERFALLYRLLWRLRAVPQMLDYAADPDVAAAEAMAKAVRRDVHKMHAFVRFRRVDADDGPHYVAWFEPEHHIVARAAPFFAERFATMRWSILTPEKCAHWDGKTLAYSPGVARRSAPPDDELEALWRTYYASTFNPARLNVDAMTREMPKKYWRNLPEAALIPDLVADAARRTDAMVAAPPGAPPPFHDRLATRRERLAELDVPALSVEELRRSADGCRHCPLWRDATQTVFGEGPATAELMLVGEQPGDQEDLQGRPFVGPAGGVLDRALAAAAIDRNAVYLTNAVKHFKHVRRGKRRLHQRPEAAEIEACKWWLAEERRLVAPRLTVALGATAARALLGRPVAIARMRGRILAAADDSGPVLVTAHPSYVLRLPEESARADELARLVGDLKTARAWLTDSRAA